jgi:Uma2 family endonuclease
MTQAIVTQQPPLQPEVLKAIAKANSKPEIVWEKLPANFVLPDAPVESIAQSFLAAALNDSLEIAQILPPEAIVASNMALVAKINRKTVVKAPDWFYIPKTHRTPLIRRSYSPHIDGEAPAIVMEFLSEEETGEYSTRPTFPYGKMYFYEQILQVSLYVIFDPEDGRLEIRQLNVSGQYELQGLDENGRYFVESLNLYLGTWHGTRLDQTFHWLRWWNVNGEILPWGTERVAQEQILRAAAEQRAETEKQRAEAEKQRADFAEQEIARLKQLLGEKG